VQTKRLGGGMNTRTWGAAIIGLLGFFLGPGSTASGVAATRREQGSMCWSKTPVRTALMGRIGRNSTRSWAEEFLNTRWRRFDDQKNTLRPRF